MKWGPHLRGGPRLQFTSLGQETGNDCQGKPSQKKKKKRIEKKKNTGILTHRRDEPKECKGRPRSTNEGECAHWEGTCPERKGRAWGYG